ncbi:MAG: hypothetical protein ACO3F3_16315 [Gemmataceae bacterium]
MSPPDESQDKVTTLRIRQKTLRIFQICAAWKNMSMIDYLDYLAKTQGIRDLKEAEKGISNLGKDDKQ